MAGHFIILLLPLDMRLDGVPYDSTKPSVAPSASVPDPAWMSPVSPLWEPLNWILLLPNEMKIARVQATPPVLYSPSDAVPRPAQVVPQCSSLISMGASQIVQMALGPGAGGVHLLERGGEISEGPCWVLGRTTGRPFKSGGWRVGGWSLTFHYIKAEGTMATSHSSFLLLHLVTNTYVSTKIRAQPKSQQDFWKWLLAGVSEATCSPCRCESQLWNTVHSMYPNIRKVIAHFSFLSWKENSYSGDGGCPWGGSQWSLSWLQFGGILLNRCENSMHFSKCNFRSLVPKSSSCCITVLCGRLSIHSS